MMHAFCVIPSVMTSRINPLAAFTLALIPYACGGSPPATDAGAADVSRTDISLTDVARADVVGTDLGPSDAGTVADPAIRVAAGEQHSLVLTRAGTVYAFGNNADGQAGHPESVGVVESPDPVAGLGEVTEVFAGAVTSFVLRRDGSVLGFGFAQDGRLGVGSSPATRQYSPLAFAAQGASISVMAGGSEHTLALTTARRVLAVGANRSGEVGNNSRNGAAVPIELPLMDVRSIAAGNGGFSVVANESGALYTWGNNSVGQLGDGTTVAALSPQILMGVEGVTQVAAGGEHGLALRTDGTVVAWGVNSAGQLGLGSLSASQRATAVPGLTNVTWIGAGNAYSVVLRSDGSVWVAGSDAQGQQGNGNGQTAPQTSFTAVPGLNDVVRVAAGSSHILVIRANGAVWGWGLNDQSQLGTGIAEMESSPIRVPL